MKMKKFTAPSIAEAMKQIRIELGDDAVIINSKVVTTKKFFGFVQKKHFEVVAGVDPIEQKQNPPLFPYEPSPKQEMSLVKTKPDYLKADSQDLSVSTNQSGMNEELKQEINDLKLIMQSLKKQTVQESYPDELLYVIEFLRNQELDDILITEITDELFVQIQNGEHSKKQLFEMAKTYLYNRLTLLPLGGLDYSKKYVHVLGPTGVGKTTTIAKMAARAVLEKKKKIGFITTDTYRIAAIDQLKTYAALLQAPVEIVYNLADYHNAIEKMGHLDLIFIDTAGRNFKEEKFVHDLKDLIHFSENSQSYLVLSLTSKQKDLEVVIEKFSSVPIEKLIFTKLDETNSIGTMFNLMIKYSKGLAYYTNGQEVPEDIEAADINGLLETFFQGEL